MRVLFIGDIVGKPGRRIVRERLFDLVENLDLDLVVANCENTAAGFGITPDLANQLFEAGIDVLTSGNHIFDRKGTDEFLAATPRLLRPANYPDGVAGRGVYQASTSTGVPYAVLNLQGRVYLPTIDCPFRKADELLEEIDGSVKVRLVDFHAEVTSEKIAFGWYLDGRVTAVLGTHTHTQTADERVLPQGTAFITDVGMTGPYDSVIGMNKQASISRFLHGVPTRFEPATGDVRLASVIVEVDETTGQASSIERRVLRES